MKEFKGTPGPWYVEDGALGNETIIVLSDNFPFKMMSKENLNLITAAPDLLEALQEVVKVLDSAGCEAATVKAKAAISKALGE